LVLTIEKSGLPGSSDLEVEGKKTFTAFHTKSNKEPPRKEEP
jgi:hypothetical protein